MGNRSSRVRDRETKARPASQDIGNSDGPEVSVQPEHTVLLLGPSGSGKSTIMKQLKILYQNGYTYEELLAFRPLIWKNLMECTHALVEGLERFHLEPSQPQNKESLRRLKEYVLSGDRNFRFDSTIAQDTYHVWTDGTIPTSWEHSPQVDLMDSATYFFKHARRIGQENYVPTNEDILRVRERISSKTEIRFTENQRLIYVLDVIGSRLQSTKWASLFGSVTSILFCASLSEYDEAPSGKDGQHGMKDSLALFDSIVNSRWFSRTSIILLFTKLDIFRRKLPKVPMEKFYPDYTGGANVNSGAKYILWKYMQMNRARLCVYPQIVDATSTTSVRSVFVAVEEAVRRTSIDRVLELL
ncbi:unnamed protein product [Peniophora sp. CBMAI 1063]|nr:unnamed protein product [Peniophora sp. CBMAI 1063]